VTIDPVVRSKEVYDAKFVYENLEADTIGDVSVQVASVAAFGTAAAHVMGDDDLANHDRRDPVTRHCKGHVLMQAEVL
jgi:hypothetical protein